MQIKFCVEDFVSLGREVGIQTSLIFKTFYILYAGSLHTSQAFGLYFDIAIVIEYVFGIWFEFNVHVINCILFCIHIDLLHIFLHLVCIFFLLVFIAYWFQETNNNAYSAKRRLMLMTHFCLTLD